METQVIVKKTDMERLGKKLFKEVDEFLHDEYTLSYPKFREEQEKFDKAVDGKDKDNLDAEKIYHILLNLDLNKGREFDEDLYSDMDSFIVLCRVLLCDFMYLKH